MSYTIANFQTQFLNYSNKFSYRKTLNLNSKPYLFRHIPRNKVLKITCQCCLQQKAEVGESFQSANPTHLIARKINQQISSCQNLSDLWNVLSVHQDALDFINVSTAFNRLPEVVSLQKRDSKLANDVVTFLVNYYLQNFVQFGPQQLSNMVQGLGKIRWQPSKQWEMQILLQLRQDVSYFKKMECSRVLHGITGLKGIKTTNSRKSPLQHQWKITVQLLLDQYFTQQLDSLEPYTTAQILWALAKVNFLPNQQQFLFLIDEIDNFVGKVQERDWCMSLYGITELINQQKSQQLILEKQMRQQIILQGQKTMCENEQNFQQNQSNQQYLSDLNETELYDYQKQQNNQMSLNVSCENVQISHNIQEIAQVNNQSNMDHQFQDNQLDQNDQKQNKIQFDSTHYEYFDLQNQDNIQKSLSFSSSQQDYRIQPQWREQISLKTQFSNQLKKQIQKEKQQQQFYHNQIEQDQQFQTVQENYQPEQQQQELQYEIQQEIQYNQQLQQLQQLQHQFQHEIQQDIQQYSQEPQQENQQDIQQNQQLQQQQQQLKHQFQHEIQQNIQQYSQEPQQEIQQEKEQQLQNQQQQQLQYQYQHELSQEIQEYPQQQQPQQYEIQQQYQLQQQQQYRNDQTERVIRRLYRYICTGIDLRPLKYNPQRLAVITRSMAMLQIGDMPLVQRIVQYSIAWKNNFRFIEIQQVLWGISFLVKNQYVLNNDIIMRMFVEMRDKILEKIDKFQAQGLSNLFLAYARMQIWDEKLFAELSVKVDKRLEEFSLVEICGLLRACGEIWWHNYKILNEGLMLKLVERIKHSNESLSDKEIDSVAKSLAKLQHYDEQLLHKLNFLIQQNIQNLSLMHSVSIFHSFVYLSFTEYSTIQIFIEHFTNNFNEVEQWNSWLVVNVLWCLGILNLHDTPLFNKLLQFINQFQVFQFKIETLSQIYESYMMAYNEKWNQVDSVIMLAAERTWKERIIKQKKIPISIMQKQIQTTMLGMYLSDVQYREIISDGRFPADFSVRIGNRQIVVLVGGGYMYSRQPPYRELGPVIAKRRVLFALGWECLIVPFYEWYELKGKNQHEEYLKQKLFGQT